MMNSQLTMDDDDDLSILHNARSSRQSHILVSSGAGAFWKLHDTESNSKIYKEPTRNSSGESHKMVPPAVIYIYIPRVIPQEEGVGLQLIWFHVCMLLRPRFISAARNLSQAPTFCTLFGPLSQATCA